MAALLEGSTRSWGSAWVRCAWARMAEQPHPCSVSACMSTSYLAPAHIPPCSCAL